MRTLRTGCLLLVLLGAVEARGAGDWIPAGPGAGTIVGIAATPAAILAATPAAVFRSTDQGAHWVLAMTGLRRPDGSALLLTAIAADPTDPSVVWVGTRDSAVYRTRDGADSWSRVTV